mmetsp:Transcript_23401/g.60188  ORF Transcript_23401/g.60188 Transcript_23401/m.60188 type:complete len:201 (+) Transcript_23401:1827-2429(+)
MHHMGPTMIKPVERDGCKDVNRPSLKGTDLSVLHAEGMSALLHLVYGSADSIEAEGAVGAANERFANERSVTNLAQVALARPRARAPASTQVHATALTARRPKLQKRMLRAYGALKGGRHRKGQDLRRLNACSTRGAGRALSRRRQRLHHEDEGDDEQVCPVVAVPDGGDRGDAGADQAVGMSGRVGERSGAGAYAEAPQ